MLILYLKCKYNMNSNHVYLYPVCTVESSIVYFYIPPHKFQRLNQKNIAIIATVILIYLQGVLGRT